jgi:hypothetical protein
VADLAFDDVAGIADAGLGRALVIAWLAHWLDSC